MPQTTDKSPRVKSSSASPSTGPFSLHFSAAGCNQCHIVASMNQFADPYSASLEIYRQIESFLQREGLQVVHERVFGGHPCYPAVMEARSQAMLDASGVRASLLTYVQGKPLWGDGLAGLQIRAVRSGHDNTEVIPIMLDGRPCGRRWSCNGITYLMLQNLHGLSLDSGPKPVRRVQAEVMFDRARQILESQGASFNTVVRTWIYLSDILDWYGEFNEIRNAKYQGFGLMPRQMNQAVSTQFVLPASTGIQGDNPPGAAVVADLLAIVPQNGGSPPIDFLSNQRQKDAFRYGAAFSRGALIKEPGLTQFQISGTAAIDEKGVSLFPNDMHSQVERTFDNLEALMEPVGASFKKIVSATVFIKNEADAPLYWQVANRRGLAQLPAVYLVADVCRPELLFEFDAEAAW
jgi:enamine deaminase RidA (YjgF/YER057c/UK114 family)